MSEDIWANLPGETSEQWVRRITPLVRSAFRGITDPVERFTLAKRFAAALDVPASKAWLFLTAPIDDPVNTSAPAQEADDGNG